MKNERFWWMNERHPELTSALLDGELDPEARKAFISAITGPEQEELARFERYCLIGDAIRGESSMLAVSVASRVHESLRDEPVVLAPAPRRSRPWLRPVAGVAVAASVAVAAVILAPQLMTQPQVDGEPVQLATELTRPPARPSLASAGVPDPRAGEGPQTADIRPATEPRWQGLTPALEDRLNRLVIEHHEFGGRTGINGPVPHIGLVSYGTR